MRALIQGVFDALTLELSATVDEQKKLIRKLNLKVAKLEGALKRERKGRRPTGENFSDEASTNPEL